jgi:hypothetical protein
VAGFIKLEIEPKNASRQHGIATIAGSEVFSGSLPRFGFITAESDEARKSATVAIPGPLAFMLKEILLSRNYDSKEYF